MCIIRQIIFIKNHLIEGKEFGARHSSKLPSVSRLTGQVTNVGIKKSVRLIAVNLTLFIY